MSKSVSILCLNGRRRTIKFAPTHTVSQIIEDVCSKENIEASLYDLRTSKAVIDRTLLWRYTNLPNNAKLELCSRNVEEINGSSNVKIALQLQNGQRLMGEFPTTIFLSDILKHFSDQLKSILDSEIEGVPTIVYMRQNLVGNELLSSTTLSVLGIIKGSALLRLSYHTEDKDSACSSGSTERLNKGPEVANALTEEVICEIASPKVALEHEITQISENAAAEMQSDVAATISPSTTTDETNATDSTANADATADTNQTQKECNSMQTASIDEQVNRRNESKGEKIATTSKKRMKVEADTTTAEVKSNETATATTSSLEQVDLSEFKFPAESNGVNLYNPQSPDRKLISDEECPRRPMLFNERSHAETDSGKREIPDEFFEITVDDLRKMMADLKQERKKFEEKEMLTEEQRKTRRLQLASKYPHIVIRIILPDRLVLQGIFRPLEKLQRLYEFVQEHLAAKSFYLFTSPPKQILKDKETTLFENNLAPAARVYFGTNETTETLLREQTLSLLCTGEDANQELLTLKNG